MSRVLPIARVDVFASRPFTGNPAAAVLDADGLTEADMQAIAREMRAPGTSFVSRAARPDADYVLRKFTPTREVAYSGHTTLGAVRTLLDAGRLSGDRVVFATTQGLLPVGDRAERGRARPLARAPAARVHTRSTAPSRTSSTRWA